MRLVEIDFVVKDCKKAIELYENIFEIEVIQATNLEKGLNEAIFDIYGVRFHILDENPEYMLLAPKENEGRPIWFNITVDDIKKTFDRAVELGCSVISPITEVPTHNSLNAMFSDQFGYIWLLHEVKDN